MQNNINPINSRAETLTHQTGLRSCSRHAMSQPSGFSVRSLSKTQKRPPEPGRRFCVPDQYDPAIAERLFLVDFGISVDSFVAQFFFDTEQLVVFGHTVGTAQ